MPMPRRKNPILKLRKALALILSRKFINQKVLLLRRNKKYKLFRDYNYAYIREYQFSPSNTPLISYHYNHSGFSKKRRSRIMYLLCGGAGMGSMIETNLDYGEFEPMPLPMNRETEETRVVEVLEWNGGDNVEENADEGAGGGEEDDDLSVDGRAQRFIERFYEEIRLERQQSLIQWKEMLQRSC
ncbi:Cytosolic phospholipase A2 [Rhynchospora pubera]|uniref:Cytosolic phospholipase A2 n=1 Tax=Rhynchospora pubera TaxID=906938 RepID=A0AAV8CAC7_9POAL|nr:Cytosolic phospholipase A2 [Rhynchospora pubera]